MITISPGRRLLAALSLGFALTATISLIPADPAASATSAVSRARGAACPDLEDPIEAAVVEIDIERITPEPSWRESCGTLYRSDSRDPDIVFEAGFAPRDAANGQYDLERYVLVNQPSPYVSTSYDHDLYKQWYKSGYNYYIDAPGGIDVNATIGDTHKWADQVEVAFPGGIRREYIIGVCPVDKTTKTEIMSDCEDNPYYDPWHY